MVSTRGTARTLSIVRLVSALDRTRSTAASATGAARVASSANRKADSAEAAAVRPTAPPRRMAKPSIETEGPPCGRALHHPKRVTRSGSARDAEDVRYRGLEARCGEHDAVAALDPETGAFDRCAGVAGG